MSFHITCPYCFREFEDHEVHFRSERVNHGDDDILPENYYGDINRFIDRYEGHDKDEIIKQYREWEFFLETDDELYDNFWSTFDGTTEYDSADEFLGVPAYRRRVIDPSQESGHRRYLKKQEDGSWFIRDSQGMVTQVELKTGERCNRRVCPYCHNPLPANYGKSNQKFVSLIGITNAGKTVYLSQLLYRLKTYAALAGLSAVVNASSTKAFLDKNRIEAGKPIPAPTPHKSLQQPQFYEMVRDNGINGKITETFVLYDVAGEVFEKGTTNTFAPFIEHSDGLVMLIDPMQFEVISGAVDDEEKRADPATVLDAIHGIISHGNSNQKCSVPLAVCLSKFDKPALNGIFDDDLRERVLQEEIQGVRRNGSRLYAPVFNAHEHNPIARALDEWMQLNNIDLVQQLESGYSDYSYFAFTALGCPVVESNDGSGGVPEGPIEPKRVAEPILWLFERLGYITANEPLYDPAGELVVCPECGFQDIEELTGDDAYITEGFIFKKKIPVNHMCKRCGHKWWHEPTLKW